MIHLASHTLGAQASRGKALRGQEEDEAAPRLNSQSLALSMVFCFPLPRCGFCTARVQAPPRSPLLFLSPLWVQLRPHSHPGDAKGVRLVRCCSATLRQESSSRSPGAPKHGGEGKEKQKTEAHPNPDLCRGIPVTAMESGTVFQQQGYECWILLERYSPCLVWGILKFNIKD